MPSTKDKAGRPIVVVTGMGVVTSLGAGKADNWAKLTAGKSGIRTITRFADRRPEDPHRRHRRFRAGRAAAPRRRCPSGSPTSPPRKRSPNPASARRGDFPGPLFLAVPPIEIEWPQRSSSRRPPAPTTAVSYDDLLRAAATGQFTAYHERFMFGSVADHLAEKFGTKGSPISLSTACASGATAIQLGVEAIRRGETDAALCIGTDGSVNPESLIRFSLLSALSTSNDPPASARPSRSPRTATASSWPKAPARWCWKAWQSRQGARRENPRRDRRLRRDGRRLPPHPLEPGRQADHRLHPQCARPMPGLTPDDIDYVNRARHRHAGERQDGMPRRHPRCSASARRACRSRPTSR